MSYQRIDRHMKEYIHTNEIAGAALIIRKNRTIIYQNKWGYANIERQLPVQFDTIFRMASLTKVVTAAAVLVLVEQGKMHLDDEISKYIPELDHLMVCTTEFGLDSFSDLANVDLSAIEHVPANRNVTIRDLLSHSSGLGMGIAGLLLSAGLSSPEDTLESRFHKFKDFPADFEPGEQTGYSGIVGFDVLGRAIEVSSGMSLTRFFQKYLFDPLEMKDTTFHLNEQQKERLAVLYKVENGEIFKAPAGEDVDGLVHGGPRYCSAAGGLYSTASDFDRFAHMLLHEGEYSGTRILQPETVRLIHQERAYKQLDFAPGLVWGLGVLVREYPERANSSLTKGSYGWSGHYGTHLFIDPVKKFEVVLMLNRSNIGGAGSHVSKKIEDLVYSAI
ncbi:serine hydrolase domain-containing protein [Paenibacillus lautus]|uniref:serine hydrolase domain-containing protein n=1 Tax=Paenibacillus lautus TaxID=1401 RepID=UPI003D9A851E